MSPVRMRVWDGLAWRTTGSDASFPTRLAKMQPFSSSAAFNMAISTTASYAASTEDKTAAIIAHASGATINCQYWSVQVRQALDADPIVTVSNPTTAEVYLNNIRIPTDFQPPLGSGGYTADGNSFIIQPPLGHSGHDFYKLLKVDDTHWTSTRVVAQDATGSGIASGVRAAGVSLANGLIRSAEIEDAATGVINHFPHVLGMSIPKEYLKLTPMPTDGQVVSGVAVWPANSQDYQPNTPYSGMIPMGSLFAIPASVDVEALGLSGPSAALARTLQKFGVVIVDQSSSWALYAQSSSDTVKVNAMITAWRTLVPYLRRVTTNTSSTPGGGAAPRLAPFAAPLT